MDCRVKPGNDNGKGMKAEVPYSSILYMMKPERSASVS
jgi:hypothetical protein